MNILQVDGICIPVTDTVQKSASWEGSQTLHFSFSRSFMSIMLGTFSWPAQRKTLTVV